MPPAPEPCKNRVPTGGRSVARSRTTFKAGQTGNPHGRPPGSKDVMPKVRDLVNAVRTAHEKEIAEALRRAASNPKTVLAFVELEAKLNREIGPGSDVGSWPGIILLGADPTVEGYRRAAARVGRVRDDGA